MGQTWLPALIDVHYNSDLEWNRLVSRLYSIFLDDFIAHRCFYNTFLVIFDDRKIDSNYEEGFWHLITRKDDNLYDRSPGRYFDPERAARLPWCRPTIEHSSEVCIRVWDFLEANGRTNTYIWLYDLDYIVILQKRKHVAFLVTAYHIDGDANRRSVQIKYNNRVI